MANGAGNVMDFGAKGDGKADDTNALQAALNSGYSEIYIPKGIYKITQPLKVNNRNGMTVYGANSTLSFSNVATGLEFNKCSHIEVRDLEFNGNYSSNYLVRFNTCSNIHVLNLIIRDCRRSGTDPVIGLRFVGTTFITVEFCHIYNIDSPVSKVARGIYFAYDDAGKICRYIEVRKCIIQNITPVDDGDGIQLLQEDGLAGVTDGSSDALIFDCTFIDCAKRGVKAQAKGVKVVDCQFFDQNFKYKHSSAIALFCSNSSAIGNRIKYNYCTSVIAVNNSNDKPQSNIIIEANIIEISAINTQNQYGILFGYANSTWRCDNVIIKDNIFIGDKYYTVIQYTYGNNIQVTGNISEQKGITIGQVNTVYPVINAKISNNTFSTITLAARDSHVSFNTIRGDTYGIDMLAPCNNVKVNNNLIANQTVGMIVRDKTVNIQICENTFSQNINLDAQISGREHQIFSNIGLSKLSAPQNGQIAIQNNKTTQSASPPTTGSWDIGDITYNSLPKPGGYVGWICTSAGEPGIWKPFGPISQ
ncbi:glycosyl hydrolase family 28-related protein [Paenibacillus sp. GYB003]|uniref:glycosyl hydrolase family 28-related protein n=1 Tax=Paenibacillus sp. GYB003 TaxID=2994392 RepID=UPI002F961FE9